MDDEAKYYVSSLAAWDEPDDYPPMTYQVALALAKERAWANQGFAVWVLSDSDDTFIPLVIYLGGQEWWPQCPA